MLSSGLIAPWDILLVLPGTKQNLQAIANFNELKAKIDKFSCCSTVSVWAIATRKPS
jgi:hypothetical protein